MVLDGLLPTRELVLDDDYSRQEVHDVFDPESQYSRRRRAHYRWLRLNEKGDLKGLDTGSVTVSISSISHMIFPELMQQHNLAALDTARVLR